MTSWTGLNLRRRFRRAGIFLAAPLILSVAICHFQGRQFFLTRLWQGVPSSNLSPRPERAINFRKIEPGVKDAAITVERAADVTADAAPLRLDHVPRLRAFPLPKDVLLRLLLSPLSGSPSGLSPPR